MSKASLTRDPAQSALARGRHVPARDHAFFPGAKLSPAISHGELTKYNTDRSFEPFVQRCGASHWNGDAQLLKQTVGVRCSVALLVRSTRPGWVVCSALSRSTAPRPISRPRRGRPTPISVDSP